MLCLLLTERLNYNKDSWLITYQEELTLIRVKFYGRQLNLFFNFCVNTFLSTEQLIQSSIQTLQLDFFFFFLIKMVSFETSITAESKTQLP